jgi:hypothetical protein
MPTGGGGFRFDHVRAGTVQVSLVERLQWDTVNRWSARATVVDDATTSVRLEATGDARITGRIEGDRSELGALRVDARWLGPAAADAAKEAVDGELRDRSVFASGERFEFRASPPAAGGSPARALDRRERWWSARTEVTVAAGRRRGDAAPRAVEVSAGLRKRGWKIPRRPGETPSSRRL